MQHYHLWNPYCSCLGCLCSGWGQLGQLSFLAQCICFGCQYLTHHIQPWHFIGFLLPSQWPPKPTPDILVQLFSPASKLHPTLEHNIPCPVFHSEHFKPISSGKLLPWPLFELSDKCMRGDMRGWTSFCAGMRWREYDKWRWLQHKLHCWRELCVHGWEFYPSEYLRIFSVSIGCSFDNF